MSEKKIIAMEHSKYRIEYVPGREWDYRVLRGDEDVTKMVQNNALTDVIFELMHYKEAEWQQAEQASVQPKETAPNKPASRVASILLAGTIGEAARFRLRETKALDAFGFRKQIEVGKWNEDAQEYNYDWHKDLELVSVTAKHNSDDSRIVITFRPKDPAQYHVADDFTFKEEYLVSDDRIRFLDTQYMKIQYPFDDTGMEGEVKEWYDKTEKEFWDKWADYAANIEREAAAIVAKADQFARDYDYFDYMDAFEESGNARETDYLLNDVSGKECFAMALYFYKAARDLSADPAIYSPGYDLLRLKATADHLRFDVVRFAEKWFHNEITPEQLKAACLQDEKEMAERHRKYMNHKEEER